MAAPRAVRVELERPDAAVLEPLAGGRPRGDRAGRGDVVGRDRVAQDGQRRGPRRCRRRRPVSGRHAHRGTAAARCTWTPGPRRSGRPSGSTGPASGRRPRRRPRRCAGTARGRSTSPMTVADLVRRRPDVGEEDRGAVAADAERLARQVDVDPAGEGERHDQRRRGEVAGAGERMDPALEVAVARQDRGHDEVVRLDGRRRPPRRAARSCRCRSCSRSRPGRTRAPRAAPSARPPRGSRSPPSSRGRATS